MKLGGDLQTVLVNPQGQAFDIGKTQYPDINPAHLLKYRVEELKADFLVLHICPVASGGGMLTVFTILPDNTPFRAADIEHHWETLDNPRETLFTDSDGDGIPELRDWNAYRWHGTNTYYSFDGRQFHPLWRDYYEAPADDDYNMKFVLRTKAH